MLTYFVIVILKEALGMIRTFISSLSIETIKGSGIVAYKFFQNWLRVPDRVADWYMKGACGVASLWERYFSPQKETPHRWGGCHESGHLFF